MRHAISAKIILDGAILILLFGLEAVVDAQEDCAHVVGATATQSDTTGTWMIAATVSSTETGWDKYADEWRIENPADGAILGTRVLAHPHENEQPFTRSLSGVEIPGDIDVVTISARDSMLGYCGDTFQLTLRGTTIAPSQDLESATSTTTLAPSSNVSGTFTNETVANLTDSPVFSMERRHPPTLIIDSTIMEETPVSRAASRRLLSWAALVWSFGWTLL